mmetsp:Transcript_12291/g.49312  ORF Transcript_12291/g.49312 Transcript_12291/m.49312 type:complete len:169 (+) Transcript_12291:142-648(+)
MASQSSVSGLQFLQGDATHPSEEARPAVIVHVCNDKGKWGRGFVLAVSKRWWGPERTYLEPFKHTGEKLGIVQFVSVEEDLWVANMIAQHGIGTRSRRLQYDHLATCLSKVMSWIEERRMCGLDRPITVHMPRIGCGLAGGEWEQVEDIVRTTLVDQGVAVFVYDFIS